VRCSLPWPLHLPHRRLREPEQAWVSGWRCCGDLQELFTAYCEIGSTADENSGTLPSSQGASRQRRLVF
jgi:hypothetical protein